mgnify:CR=1 FL=1
MKNVNKIRMPKFDNIFFIFLNNIFIFIHNNNIRLILVELRVLLGHVIGFLKFEQRLIIV